MISESADLERDITAWLQSCAELKCWIDATKIGMEMGFERRVSARKVQRSLTKLVKDGVLECDRGSPNIYRIKVTNQIEGGD